MSTKPFVHGTPAEEYDWSQIENPGPRVYHYPDGSVFEIDDTVTHVAVKRNPDGTHTHRCWTQEGVAYYVAPGWRVISWYSPFEF